MYIARRTLQIINAFLKSYGPSNIKRILWDWEYSGNKWNFVDNTVGDCVYSHLERHAANGSVLDLGCGTGNTANELAVSAYRTYLGVDISKSALRKAIRRSEKNGRAHKNRFVLGDFLGYVPTEQFDVILFRESMYHVPLGKTNPILYRYSHYLREDGVFIVRMSTTDGLGQSKYRPTAMVGAIERDFDVVEKCQYGEFGPTVIVFRPRVPVADRVGRYLEGHNVGGKNA